MLNALREIFFLTKDQLIIRLMAFKFIYINSLN